jgi:hypothetical protein
MSSTSFGSDHSIDARKAEGLVREALIALNLNGPAVKIERMRYDYAPEFYAFMASWPNPGGSSLLGYYAVNPWTGDVWDTIACKRVTSASLHQEQEAIWKRSGLLAEAEATLHEKSPGCSPVERNKSLRK